MPSLSEALAMAIGHHQGGRLEAAEQMYREILQVDPHQAHAMHLLGVIAYQVGKHEIAEAHIRRAIGLKENEADFHYHLAKVHSALNRTSEAVSSYRRALTLNPNLAEACYDPLTESPPVSALPAFSAGCITFGSLNNYCKVNEAVIALWSRALCTVKNSRLLLLSQPGAHRERALQEFQRHGVGADRIEWFTPAPRRQYLAAYHRIDLGLDTFPYNGHTTSLDSAWMGVPTITLVGNTIVGRGGLSQAMNLGLPELVAYSPDQYVEIAAALAQDLPRLRELRATLRNRMQGSPLMDASRFTRNIETAYRQMWQRWCGGEEVRMTNDKP